MRYNAYRLGCFVPVFPPGIKPGVATQTVSVGYESLTSEKGLVGGAIPPY